MTTEEAAHCAFPGSQFLSEGNKMFLQKFFHIFYLQEHSVLFWRRKQNKCEPDRNSFQIKIVTVLLYNLQSARSEMKSPNLDSECDNVLRTGVLCSGWNTLEKAKPL
jgi:hypothetical protein